MDFLFLSVLVLFFFFKQKTAYEMRISDWSSDVCSSDLLCRSWLLTEDHRRVRPGVLHPGIEAMAADERGACALELAGAGRRRVSADARHRRVFASVAPGGEARPSPGQHSGVSAVGRRHQHPGRSEERRVGEGWVST